MERGREEEEVSIWAAGLIIGNASSGGSLLVLPPLLCKTRLAKARRLTVLVWKSTAIQGVGLGKPGCIT
jgi:hypothetical protein